MCVCVCVCVVCVCGCVLCVCVSARARESALPSLRYTVGALVTNGACAAVPPAAVALDSLTAPHGFRDLRFDANQARTHTRTHANTQTHARASTHATLRVRVRTCRTLIVHVHGPNRSNYHFFGAAGWFLVGWWVGVDALLSWLAGISTKKKTQPINNPTTDGATTRLPPQKHAHAPTHASPPPHTNSPPKHNTQGLFLNGEHYKVRGFCDHSSWAVVGAAVPDRVNLFRAQASRAVGGNGRRTSHNPPESHLLQIYDRVGIVVSTLTHAAE